MARITIDPAVIGGVPYLRGLRIPVSTVVNMVAGGMTAQQIVDELPPLEIEDVAAALRFAADAVADREIPLSTVGANRNPPLYGPRALLNWTRNPRFTWTSPVFDTQNHGPPGDEATRLRPKRDTRYSRHVTRW